MNPLGLLITDIDLSLVSATGNTVQQQPQNPIPQQQGQTTNNIQQPGQIGQ